MARFQKNYEEQEARQKLFPPDRIAFFRNAATQDITAMTAWADGMISFEKLCLTIAYNNYLDHMFPAGIPHKMMENELRIIGWYKEEY